MAFRVSSKERIKNTSLTKTGRVYPGAAANFGRSWLDPPMGIVGAVPAIALGKNVAVGTREALLDRENNVPVQQVEEAVGVETETGDIEVLTGMPNRSGNNSIRVD